MSGNNIKVVCRFRPQNSLENREGGVPIISIDEEGTNVQLKVTIVIIFFFSLTNQVNFRARQQITLPLTKYSE